MRSPSWPHPQRIIWARVEKKGKATKGEERRMESERECEKKSEGESARVNKEKVKRRHSKRGVRGEEESVLFHQNDIGKHIIP